MITVKVKFLLDNKRDEEAVALESGETILDLIEGMGIKDANYYIFIVNGINKFGDYTLKDGDIVQLFPQMSGG